MVAAAEFRAALRRFLRQSETIARRMGLTPQRHMLLLMIKAASAGGQQSSLAELAEKLQIAESTVAELAQRAESAGLIKRERSRRDRRVTHLSLTPEGERRLMLSFTGLDAERAQLREAFSNLKGGLTG